VGGEKTLTADVRVISATNRNLQKAIAEGKFREDLYYRLNVVPVMLPPLRERRNDIPLLVEHTLKRVLRDLKRPSDIKMSPEALDIMMSYDWPGNVRELQNCIQFALVKCREEAIKPEHLPPSLVGELKVTPRKRRRKLDPQSVRDAIAQANGNKVEAAKLLSVSRATLYRFLDRFGSSL
jgi:DNA-binding NtrC family response regulator